MSSSHNSYITEQINVATKALNSREFDKVINICENIISKNKDLNVTNVKRPMLPNNI